MRSRNKLTSGSDGQDSATADRVAEQGAVSRPCANCPWRIANHGKRTPWGFYTKTNLRRLWNQIRRGGAQSCHPTDPNHPDHIAAGAKPGATPKECPGSVILIFREFAKMANDKGVIEPESCSAYLRDHKDGLTKSGIAYWAVSRLAFGGVRFVGGPKLPDVDVDDPEIGRL